MDKTLYIGVLITKKGPKNTIYCVKWLSYILPKN
nr:MAG TPA: hypothetical protein [Caudoviricetes sp.]